MKYTCPVCGYPNLSEPPRNFSICPSCGTEFENDDYDQTHKELRLAWVERGARWFSRATPPPRRWNAFDQLAAADLNIFTDERMAGSQSRVRTSSDMATSEVRHIQIMARKVFGKRATRLHHETLVDVQKVELCPA